MRGRWVTSIVVAGLVAAFLTGCEVGPHHDFSVTVGGEGGDADPGDGVCEAHDGIGDCTMRAAIDEANAIADSTVGPAPSFTVTLETDVWLSAVGELGVDNRIGDLDIDIGAAALTIDGGFHQIQPSGFDRAIELWSGSLTVRDLTMIEGHPYIDGGGAIRTEPSTTLVVTGSTFRNNSAQGLSGCAVDRATPNVCASILVLDGGGAIDAGGPLVVIDSTFDSNRAVPSFNSCSTVEGGVWACGRSWGGAILARSDLVVADSTFENNVIVDSGLGGSAIYATGPSTVVSSTFVYNYSPTNRQVVADSVRRSIVIYSPCEAAAVDGDGNLRTTALGTCVEEPYVVSSLADNGGGTPTLLPNAGTLAIDAYAPDATGACEGFATDQRGAPRPAGAGCDIGAVERQPTDP